MIHKVHEALLRGSTVAYATVDSALTVVSIEDPGGLWGPAGAVQPGMPLAELAWELAGNRPAIEALRRGLEPSIEHELVAREDSRGAVVYQRTLLTPDGDGGLLYIAQDVTSQGEERQRLVQSRNDLRLAEAQLASAVLRLQMANADLQRLTDFRSVFVSVTAHELRTPLAIITSYADLLAEGIQGTLEPDQLASVATIRSSAQLLLEIANNLLDLTRIEAGRMELILQVVDLGQMVAGAVRDYGPLIAEAGQRISCSVAPDLSLVLADELRAVQIIGNLLSNANKYTLPGGQIAVHVGGGESPAEAVVSVSDDGVGIPPEDHPMIGSWLFRSDSGKEVSAKGIGLGLYITRSLVELHGGRFWFESAPGSGSTFHISFLVADGEPFS